MSVARRAFKIREVRAVRHEACDLEGALPVVSLGRLEQVAIRARI